MKMEKSTSRDGSLCLSHVKVCVAHFDEPSDKETGSRALKNTAD